MNNVNMNHAMIYSKFKTFTDKFSLKIDTSHCVKVSKYIVISGPYDKYGPEITPYLGTFHVVSAYAKSSNQGLILLHLAEFLRDYL